MSKDLERRYIKNVGTGVILDWAENLSKREDMFECDINGVVVVEHLKVEDAQTVKMLEEKVKDCDRLSKENATLKKEIEKYKAMYGTKESALPTRTVKKEDVPVKKVVQKKEAPKKPLKGNNILD